MSPTQRTLKRLRDYGYLAEVVERFIPGAHIRRDMFGIADVIALRGKEIIVVQCCSAGDVSKRVAKIESSDKVAAVREAGIGIFVHGWRKNAKGRWVVREVDVS